MKNITVLGGGISGLAAAFYLSKTCKVSLFQGPMKGGWVQSLSRSGQLIELGPRSMRHAGVAGKSTLDLIGISSQVVTVPKESAAAKYRYILYDGKLNQLSNNPIKMLLSSAPILKGFFKSLMMEPFRSKGIVKDESIESFISRRLSKKISDSILSAVLHGIYAGDVAKLSIRSTFKSLWDMEQAHGSIFGGMIKSPKVPPYQSDNPEAQIFIDATTKESVYSFKNGMQTLTDALLKTIVERGVTVYPESCISLNFKVDEVTVGRENGETISVDHVISTIPAPNLAALLDQSMVPLKDELDSITSVDVGMVNLVYKGDHSQLPVEGFGFLVPKTEKLKILGVVFDSCAFPQEEKATVLTVMMGGHAFEQQFGKPEVVTDSELLETALSNVDKILGIPATDLVDSVVSIHKQCIPQYSVGHSDRMLRIDALRDQRLSLTGASYNGVSVNDCIYNSKLLSAIVSS